MKPKVKQFIETYIEAIEDNSLEFVFKQAAAELSSDEISELSEVLEDVNIPTEEVRWKVFDQGVVDFIQSHLAMPSYQKDKRVTVDGHSFFEIVDQREPARINEFNGPDYAKGNAKGYGRPAKVSDIEIRNVPITNLILICIN